MNSLERLFVYRKKIISPYLEGVLKWSKYLRVLTSLLFIISVIFKYGFIMTHEDHALIDTWLDCTSFVFLLGSVFRVVFDFKSTKERYSAVMWSVTLLLYSTMIPVIFMQPTSAFYNFVWKLCDNDIFQTIVLLILSILYISDGITRILSRRINPSLVLSLSFIAIILVGAALLMLPRATYDGISFIDALFISTSATCVTGLSTIDVATVFTPLGFTFIALLIQVGGLGIMTLTSFFALSFMDSTSLYSQTMISEMVSSRSLNSLLTTLLYILGFTAIIELIGAGLIFLDIHNTLNMTLHEEVFFSLFHSISAFCNAGFSTLPNNLGNEILMSGHNPFYLTISVLIILGSVGFPILVNLHEWLQYSISIVRMRYLNHSIIINRRTHIYDINTKIVVTMTLVLVVGGTLSIGVMEWNVAFEGMPIIDKCVHSFFSAVTPRTAGFTSVNLNSYGVQTILLMIFLMVIGGGSQSTAGGIKINAFAVIILNIKAILQGKNRASVFNRTLSLDSIRRSNSTMLIYIFFVFIAYYTLTILEPKADGTALIFEVISALSTVGASLDLTPTLGSDSKVVVILLMFIGRIGVITILTSIIRQNKTSKVGLASGNIIIN